MLEYYVAYSDRILFIIIKRAMRPRVDVVSVDPILVK